MEYNHKSGFTLIEAVMVMAIVGVLSVPGAYLMSYFVNNGIYIPNKLNMDMLASDALDIMIEGDSQAKGLRFSKSIISIQDNRVIFTNQDNQAIRYRLTGATEVTLDPYLIYRSINGGPDTILPYYATRGVRITGKDNKLFTYYDAGDNVTSDPNSVRRVVIALIAQTGTGSYADLQGRSEQTSSIAVKKFQ